MIRAALLAPAARAAARPARALLVPRRLAVPLVVAPRRALADHAHAAPQEPVKVIFVDDDGRRVVASGLSGESLYQCALRHGVPLPVDTCHGHEPNPNEYGEGPECRHCHMFISSAWYNKTQPMTSEENAQLGMLDARSRFSRLSCQVILNKDLDGMVCAMAPIDSGYEIC